ncbi:M1 family aminopeptidase, partial [Acidobacteriota bacterium]
AHHRRSCINPIASNEFEEAWLDEGINSYSEIKAMDQYYGSDSSMVDFLGIKVGDWVYARAAVMGTARLDPIMTKSWDFYSSGSYGANVYSKAALTLLTLEGYLGEDVMADVMKTFYQHWKFKHPKSQDFFDVAEEVSGQDLDWFFDQFFKSPDRLDYSVGALRSLETGGPQGVFKGKLVDTDTQTSDEDKSYLSEVVIRRNGELYFPQDILIVFEDGEEIRETWDGKSRWTRFEYTRPSKLKRVQIDPGNKVLLDINLMNNTKIVKPDKTPLLRQALGATTLFQKLLTLLHF